MSEFEGKEREGKQSVDEVRSSDDYGEDKAGVGSSSSTSAGANVFRKLRGVAAPSTQFAHVLDFPVLRQAVDEIVKEAILRVLDGKAYVAGAAEDDGAVRGVTATAGAASSEQSQLQEWRDMVADRCLDSLKKLCPNFKYVVSCFLQQKAGAGVSVSTALYWDARTDSSTTVKWENETLACVVTIFGVAL